MTYLGTPQSLIITDPYDATQTAPVDKSERLTVQPGPEFYSLFVTQTKLLAAIWLTLGQINGTLVDPDAAIKEIT